MEALSVSVFRFYARPADDPAPLAVFSIRGESGARRHRSHVKRRWKITSAQMPRTNGVGAISA